MPSKAFQQFSAQLVDLESAQGRLESALGNGISPNSDILLAYEGLFLRLVVAFESYLEAYLAELLDNAHTPSVTGFVRLVQFQTPAVREAVISALDDYVAWLPMDRTIKVAALYLENGVPFSAVDSTGRSRIKQMLYIRNAIAHSSAHALSQFVDKVIGNAKLPISEQSPAGYLRGAVSSSPRTTRLNIFFQQLLIVAQSIDP